MFSLQINERFSNRHKGNELLKLRKLKVYYSLEEVPKIKNPVLTLGTFDGVHLGHQKIIQYLKESAKKREGETVLFTFHPHPRMVLHPKDHNLELIQGIEKRIQRLGEEGIDHLVLVPFTLEFAKQSATEFVRNILVNKLGVSLLTIGYNHHFGKNREGDLKLLRVLANTYNFEVQEIEALRIGERGVSSTKIRESIKNGEITKANEALGSTFCFSGEVEEGDKIGTSIGYPTANIGKIEETQVLPESGVFAVKVKILDQLLSGMLNIGYRPTVSNKKVKKVEVHLFDFNEQIYGSKIEVFLVNKIRDEQVFESLDKLKEQLKQDEIDSKHILDLSPFRV